MEVGNSIPMPGTQNSCRKNRAFPDTSASYLRSTKSTSTNTFPKMLAAEEVLSGAVLSGGEFTRPGDNRRKRSKKMACASSRALVERSPGTGITGPAAGISDHATGVDGNNLFGYEAGVEFSARVGNILVALPVINL